jgi:hypothetical protein
VITILKSLCGQQGLLVGAPTLRPARTWARRARILLPLLFVLSVTASGHVPLAAPTTTSTHLNILADGPFVQCGGIGWPC